MPASRLTEIRTITRGVDIDEVALGEILLPDLLETVILVFLDRRDAGRPDLRPASLPKLVKAMVRAAFAPHVSSSELSAGLTRLAASTDIYHLRFSSSRDAAALLSREFRVLDQATAN